MLKKILRKKRIVLIIDIILLIMSIKAYKYVYDVEKVRADFASESIRFVEENKNPVFKVSKIVLYSSAHAEDNSPNKDLQDININQFTDIAIYIDNKGKTEELSAENTVNEMFIDNIKIATNSQKGDHIFNCKNSKFFGKYQDLQNYSEDGFIFNVLKSNDEQIASGNEENAFYTDCSNPISLGFINKNILTNGKIANTNGKIAFDGSILKNANIDLNSISGKFSFSIHIKNNLDEDYVCNLNIDNNFEDKEDGIYSGYVMKVQNTEGEQYHFLKVSN